MSDLFSSWLSEAGGAAVAEPPGVPFMSAPIPVAVDDAERIECPHCGKRCRVPAGARIDRARCPRCNERITIPAASTTAVAEPEAVPEPPAAPMLVMA